MRVARRLLLALLSTLALAGCATMHELEADTIGAAPAPDAGFLFDGDRLAPHPHAPFDRVWLAPGVSFADYDRIYVPSVDTSHVLARSLWDDLNVRTPAVPNDVAKLAVELHDDIEHAFIDDPQHHFLVLDDPLAVDQHSLVLEVALTELVPNKAGVGIVGLAAWAGPLEVGIPVATVAAFVQQGQVAFELRVRDGATGNVIAMAADRETGPMRVIDLRSLTWYGNAHEIFRAWAKELVETADTPLDQPVEHSTYFTIVPW
jgi:uncharacterized protein DUF3313